MSKSQFPSTFGWQSTNPEIGFLPGPGPNQSVAGNSPNSGVVAGTATGTSTIYTNIIGLQQTDNQGIEIAWTGTPTGTILIWVSNSGINWATLTFIPAYANPTGTAGVEFLNITGIGARYLHLSYTNISGTGTISAYSQCKANNR